VQQKTLIANKRQRLQEQLNNFRKKAISLMGHVSGSPPQLEGSAPEEEEWNEEDDEYRDTVDVAAFRGLLQPPESCTIPLPSSYSRDDAQRVGWGHFLNNETALRESHAYETLRSLRLAIGERSMCYKKVVRVAKSQAASTRSQFKVEAFTQAVEKYAATYRRTARVLWKAGKSQKEWPDIKPEDLQVKGDVTDANRLGQSTYKLAWFWRMGQLEDYSENGSAMEECACLALRRLPS
jgi:hypothetical protein